MLEFQESLNTIKKLSLKDKKSNSQKLLKIAEEVGEVSQALLSVEKAPNTKERNLTHQDLLDENADLIYTSFVLYFSLGGTLEELSKQLNYKSEKWNVIIENHN